MPRPFWNRPLRTMRVTGIITGIMPLHWLRWDRPTVHSRHWTAESRLVLARTPFIWRRARLLMSGGSTRRLWNIWNRPLCLRKICRWRSGQFFCVQMCIRPSAVRRWMRRLRFWKSMAHNLQKTGRLSWRNVWHRPIPGRRRWMRHRHRTATRRRWHYSVPSMRKDMLHTSYRKT